jgi:hypothetical protein
MGGEGRNEEGGVRLIFMNGIIVLSKESQKVILEFHKGQQVSRIQE